MLALRALLSFVLLPGIVAFAVPLLLLRPRGVGGAPGLLGLPLLVVGAAGLAWCVIDFARRGEGTLAPWDPPRRLVRQGLYRYSRNPMYVAVLLLLAGWAVTFHSWALGGYAAPSALPADRATAGLRKCRRPHPAGLRRPVRPAAVRPGARCPRS